MFSKGRTMSHRGFKSFIACFVAGFCAMAGLVTVRAQAGGAGSWSMKTSLPGIRAEVTAVAVGGKLFAVGGAVGGNAVPGVEEYDPATDRWRSRAPLPEARDHLGVAVVNGKIYAFGGFVTIVHKGAGNGAFEYDPATDRWRVLAPMKGPRGSVGVAVVGGKIHVLGGRGAEGVTTVATHEVYDPASGKWSEAAPSGSSPAAR